MIVAGSGALMYRQGIKRHFLEAYLHIAANTIFAALISGADDGSAGSVPAGAARYSCWRRSRSGSGSTVLPSSPTAPSMATPGSSATVLPILGSAAAFLGYFCFTGSLVILSLVGPHGVSDGPMRIYSDADESTVRAGRLAKDGRARA